VKYRKVLELEPENSNAYAYWGAALGQLNRYRQAVEKLERALELHPNNSNVFSVLVDSLYYLKRYREAWDVVGRAREAKVSIPRGSLNRLSEVSPEPIRY
jgi:tetratricopeptide (TPR) repeat protein